jgi:cadmium resistance protein CadD (predicted permease)
MKKTNNIYKVIGIASCIALLATLFIAVMDSIVPSEIIFFGALAAVPSIYLAVTLLIDLDQDMKKNKEHETMERNQYGLPRIQSTYKAKR